MERLDLVAIFVEKKCYMLSYEWCEVILVALVHFLNQDIYPTKRLDSV